MKYKRHFIILTVVTILAFFSSFSAVMADAVIHTEEMYAPRGMSYDAKNNRIVFADYDANAIFELNLQNFKIKRIAGKNLGKNAYGLPVGGYKDGKAEDALFKNPSDVVILSNGAIVVADTGNHAIRKIFEGHVTTIAGGKKEGLNDGSRQSAEFSYPSGLAISNDVIYVSDTENDAIRIIYVRGEDRDKVKTLPVKVAKPSGLYVVNRDIYVTSMEDHALYLIEKGKTLTLLGEGEKRKDANKKSETKKAEEGYIDGRLDLARFSVPTDIFVNKEKEEMYIVDSGNHAIRKIMQVKSGSGDKFGAVQTLVGGRVGFSDEKNKRLLLDAPRSVLMINNKLYIADTNNGRILVFDNVSKLLPVSGVGKYQKCEDPKTVYIYVDGRKIEPQDVAPVLENGSTYVPVRLLTESIGGEVKWLDKEQAVLCKYGDKELKIKKDRYIIRNGRSLVPLRYIVENYGLDIEWNPEYRAVIIKTY